MGSTFTRKSVYRGWLIAPESGVTCLVEDIAGNTVVSLTSFIECRDYIDELAEKRKEEWTTRTQPPWLLA